MIAAARRGRPPGARTDPLLAELREVGHWDSRDWCDDCARLHNLADRQRILRRLLPATVAELRLALEDGWSCLYPDLSPRGAGRRRLGRDLVRLGATQSGPLSCPVWSLP